MLKGSSKRRTNGLASVQIPAWRMKPGNSCKALTCPPVMRRLSRQRWSSLYAHSNTWPKQSGKLSLPRQPTQQAIKQHSFQRQQRVNRYEAGALLALLLAPIAKLPKLDGGEEKPKGSEHFAAKAKALQNKAAAAKRAAAKSATDGPTK